MKSRQHAPTPPDNVSAVVLCGGGGTRMDGVDKGLVELAGQRLVEHVIQRLAPQVQDRIIISCNRNITAYRSFGFPCVTDAGEFSGAGPLAGLAAGLEQVRTEYCVICPCDTPLVPDNLVERMLTAERDADTGLVMAHDGCRLQYLHCLLAVRHREALLQFLRAGGRAVHAWFEGQSFVPVDFSDQQDAFRNLNTRDELQLCQSSLTEGHTWSP